MYFGSSTHKLQSTHYVRVCSTYVYSTNESIHKIRFDLPLLPLKANMAEIEKSHFQIEEGTSTYKNTPCTVISHYLPTYLHALVDNLHRSKRIGINEWFLVDRFDGERESYTRICCLLSLLIRKLIKCSGEKPQIDLSTTCYPFSFSVSPFFRCQPTYSTDLCHRRKSSVNERSAEDGICAHILFCTVHKYTGISDRSICFEHYRNGTSSVTAALNMIMHTFLVECHTEKLSGHAKDWQSPAGERREGYVKLVDSRGRREEGETSPLWIMSA